LTDRLEAVEKESPMLFSVIRLSDRWTGNYRRKQDLFTVIITIHRIYGHVEPKTEKQKIVSVQLN